MPDKVFQINSGTHPPLELVLSADRNYVTIRRGKDHNDSFQFASVFVSELIRTLKEAQRSLEQKKLVNILEDVNLSLKKKRTLKR
jgi:hypothetical protein